MPEREEESRLRLRFLNGVDAKEKARKAKPPEGKKIKVDFTVVKIASDDETRALESECDEGDDEEEKEDEEDHESDDEERPTK